MSPQITANKLAEFIIAKTPARRDAVVRSQMHKKARTYVPYYPAFKTPAKRFLEGGARDIGVLNRAIEKMNGRRGSKWKDIDSRITAEALKALRELAPVIQKLGVTFVSPPIPNKAALTFPDLTVTVTPDLLVEGERNNKPLAGAARFYTAKESTYQLTRYGAELVAVMLYQWRLHTATGARVPDVGLCMVIECFSKRVTAAPSDLAPHLAAIEKGAQQFVEAWHRLESQEAA